MAPRHFVQHVTLDLGSGHDLTDCEIKWLVGSSTVWATDDRSPLWTVLRVAFLSQENLDFSLEQQRSVRGADKKPLLCDRHRRPREGALRAYKPCCPHQPRGALGTQLV